MSQVASLSAIKIFADAASVASMRESARDPEGLCAVVWHLLVSHPALKRASTKWESTK